MEGPPLAKRKILIVDDDADLRRLVSLMLEMGGYEVIAAQSGSEALLRVRSDRPDLILLDIMMPDMDGFETCRRLRKLPEGAHIPVIMLSAADQVTDKVKGLRVGANDYITKPADSRELIARIEAHLRPAYVRAAHTIAMLGSKSGVGTTTLAVNLAVALKQLGPIPQSQDGLAQRNVILLDWHLPMGDITAVLNLTSRHTLEELAPHIEDLDQQTVEQIIINHSSGIQILPSVQALDTSPLPPTALEPVLDVISKMADFVVIDAGWASELAWVRPLETVDELLFVITPELPVLRRAAIFLEWERGHAVFGERLHLLINRTGISGGISVRDVEDLLQMKARARLPEDAESVTLSINQGVPLVQSSPRSALAQSIIRMAQEIVAHPSEKQRVQSV